MEELHQEVQRRNRGGMRGVIESRRGSVTELKLYYYQAVAEQTKKTVVEGIDVLVSRDKKKGGPFRP